MSFEPLENRRLLAVTDLASITGTVYLDSDGNGADSGEEIAGASLGLYFDRDASGTWTEADGPRLSSQATDGTGRFRFDRLSAGDYFLRQPAQTAGGASLPERVSDLITIRPDDADGVLGQIVDSFTTAQEVIAPFPLGTQHTSAVTAAEALGGERDLIGQLSAGGDNDWLRVQSGQDGQSELRLVPSLDAAGIYQVVWDGPDGQGAVLDHDGLRTDGTGLDLTQGGSITHLRLTAGVDKADAVATLRIYSDGDNWSQAVLPLTNAQGQEYLIPLLDGLSVGAGNGADVTDVGAVELTIVANRVGMNGLVTTVETRGPTVFATDFVNQRAADLALDLRVNDATPQAGEQLQFTLRVENSGPDDVTGVAITEILPAGLTVVNISPSQGTYSAASGLWDVGAVPAAGAATLQIMATIEGPDDLTVTAEVMAADLPDPDSTPGNAMAEEDDSASIVVQPLLADLSLTHSVDNPTPSVGQTVIFTVTLRNEGPEPATGISLLETLPDGIAYVSPAGTGDPINAAPIGWSVAYLPPGGETSMQVRGLVTRGGAKSVRAEIMASEQFDPDSFAGNHEATEDDQVDLTVTPLAADLSLQHSLFSGQPDVGGNVTLAVVVHNAGPGSATGIQVREQLPPGLVFLNASPTKGTFDGQTGQWSIPLLNPTEAGMLRVEARMDSTAPLTATAQVTAAHAADPDSTPANDVEAEDDQASVEVVPRTADLSLQLTVSEPQPAVGSEVIYTVTIANAGPDEASGVRVQAELPDGLEFVNAQPSLGTYDGQTGLWTVGDLATDGNAVMELSARVASIGSFTLSAEITASDRHDPDSVPNNAPSAEDDWATVSIDAYRPPPPGLTVESFLPTPSGFVVEFNREVDPSVLNLYGVKAGTLGPADVTLIGDTTGNVRGTLAVDGSTLEFVATGGTLPADRYTARLRSAEDGLRAADDAGLVLNGEFAGQFPSGDQTVGGDFQMVFQTANSVTLGLADFARGPGQSVADTGIPITLSNATGVESVDAVITYDPALLIVSDVQLGSSLPEGCQILANWSEPGVIRLAFFALEPLEAGPAVLGVITAAVPTSAVYGAVNALRISDVQVNEGGRTVLGETAVHVVAYLGDTTGNRAYSSLDAQRVARVVVGKDTGFEAYPIVDPRLIADVTGDGRISGLDGSWILQEVIGIDNPAIPPLPDVTGA